MSKFKFKRAETSGDLLAALGMDDNSDDDGDGADLNDDDPFAAGVGVPIEQLHENLRGGYRKDGTFFAMFQPTRCAATTGLSLLMPFVCVSFLVAQCPGFASVTKKETFIM